MKKNNAKRTVVVIALIALMAIPSMFAYFTAMTDTATNTFVFGDLEITLDEPNWKPDVDTDGDGVNDAVGAVVPKQTIKKDPTVTVEGAKAWVFVAVDESNVGKYINTLDINDGWSYITDARTGYKVYAYEAPLKDTTSTPLFDEVVIASNVDEDDKNANFNIKVQGYAVQAEGFADALTAWNETFAK